MICAYMTAVWMAGHVELLYPEHRLSGLVLFAIEILMFCNRISRNSPHPQLFRISVQELLLRIILFSRVMISGIYL